MNVKAVLKSLESALGRLGAQWKAYGWATGNTGQEINWTAPPISYDDISRDFEFARERITGANARGLTTKEANYLSRLQERCDIFQANNLSSDPGAIIRNALELVNSVARNIPIINPPPKVDWDDLKKNKDLVPKDLLRRLTSVDARLRDLEPRSSIIAKKVEEIEAAHEAAEQLPTDLEELKAQRFAIEEIGTDIDNIYDAIKVSHARADDVVARLSSAEAAFNEDLKTKYSLVDDMIKRSEQALRGATSVGLAKAFRSRKNSLTVAGVLWTVALATALGIGLLIGAERLGSLRDVLSGNKPASVVWANVILTLFSVGGPIWFAWLSTKQIGASFRLAEDYAFKASVSQAYEGYRTEAVSIDPALQARLFSSALTRIEEAPIRLLDKDTHSSPLAELLNNPILRANLESIPGIKDKILALISSQSAAAIVAPTAVVASALGAASQTKPADPEGTSEKPSADV